MIDVSVIYDVDLPVVASPETAFALVADIERSAGHFPGLLSIEQISDEGRWRWRMEEKGVGPIKLNVRYDAIYTVDADARTVTWQPPGASGGDMESSGSWRILSKGEGETLLEFRSLTIAHVPAPRLMKGMVEVIATEELSKLMRKYTKAIRATLGVR
jgi:carbon monoxide dehydrogenase subunit G